MSQIAGHGWKATELRLTPGDVDVLQQAVVRKLARPRAEREIQEKRDQPAAGLHTLVWGLRSAWPCPGPVY